MPAVQPQVDDLPPCDGEKQRVVVIGAGVAGLAAAYQLRAAGHEVVVLEAKSRPGGRVLSLRGDFGDGLHAEAGALFIPLDHEYVMKYVTLTGLAGELQLTPPEHLGGFYHLQGRRFLDQGTGPMLWHADDRLEPGDWPGDLDDADRRVGLDAICDRYFGNVEGGLGDPERPDWPPSHLRHLDGQTAVEMLRTLGASDAAAELIRASHLSPYGDLGRDLSPLFTMQQWVDARRQSNSTSWTTLPGGNDRWTTRLAAQLEDHIRYGAQAIAIHNGEDAATVTVLENGHQSIAEADRVVCAVPFSVLRRITITPKLSPLKTKVVSELQSTKVSHLFIECSRRVWRRPDGTGLYAYSFTDLALTAMIRDATFNQPGTRAVLDLYMVGPQSELMDELGEAERLPHALVSLEQVFPGISDVAEGAVYHSWTSDPFSRGDYVFYSPGQFSELWPHVATPEGRLHFAGDQTSVKSGWQDGAISSGHRAAREIATTVPRELRERSTR